MKRLIIILAALSIFASACGAKPEATPELKPDDVQATAVSMAWTMAAETMTAMPTATPVPPTETPTPLPTSTPTLVPTPVILPTNTPASSGDVCDQPLMKWGGADTKVVVNNETKGDVVLSIYVSSPPRGECGYISSSFGKSGTSMTIPIGCFYAYAWVSGKKNFSTQGGPFCMNNPDKWTLIIKESGIVLKSP